MKPSPLTDVEAQMRKAIERSPESAQMLSANMLGELTVYLGKLNGGMLIKIAPYSQKTLLYRIHLDQQPQNNYPWREEDKGRFVKSFEDLIS